MDRANMARIIQNVIDEAEENFCRDKRDYGMTTAALQRRADIDEAIAFVEELGGAPLHTVEEWKAHAVLRPESAEPAKWAIDLVRRIRGHIEGVDLTNMQAAEEVIAFMDTRIAEATEKAESEAKALRGGQAMTPTHRARELAEVIEAALQRERDEADRDLLDAAEAYQNLAMCYRLGKTPSDKVFEQLEKARMKFSIPEAAHDDAVGHRQYKD